MFPVTFSLRSCKKFNKLFSVPFSSCLPVNNSPLTEIASGTTSLLRVNDTSELFLKMGIFWGKTSFESVLGHLINKEAKGNSVTGLVAETRHNVVLLVVAEGGMIIGPLVWTSSLLHVCVPCFFSFVEPFVTSALEGI